MSGVPKIDLEDWKANTEYSGGFDDESPVIKVHEYIHVHIGRNLMRHMLKQWFWELMASFDRKVQVQVLQFVTGRYTYTEYVTSCVDAFVSSRVPLGGFANLVGASGLQKFIVTSSERAAGNSLPTASTWYYYTHRHNFLQTAIVLVSTY